jgi:hypothetical protein
VYFVQSFWFMITSPYRDKRVGVFVRFSCAAQDWRRAETKKRIPGHPRVRVNAPPHRNRLPRRAASPPARQQGHHGAVLRQVRHTSRALARSAITGIVSARGGQQTHRYLGGRQRTASGEQGQHQVAEKLRSSARLLPPLNGRL